MRSVLESVRRVAGFDAATLVTGETGTGKELIARTIHRASPRAAAPFVAVNCAAIPDALLESELFGHVRGAFTGAAGARPGRFVAADGGTLFLDEIGDLSLTAQAKLLRVLENRTVSPVGADKELAVDVRIVAATHRNLREMVAEGTFRADLYYRISVFPLELPPLRVRRDDIPVIAGAIVASLARRSGREFAGLTDDALAVLAEQPWPGNVRELAHCVERALIMSDGHPICATALALPRIEKPLARGTGPIPVLPQDSGLDLRTESEKLERQLIERALHQSQGNRTEAAALLGLNRTTLVEKLRRHSLEDSPRRG
jgi:transcriptional regulator with GAF, ATPase, and Fis domain